MIPPAEVAEAVLLSCTTDSSKRISFDEWLNLLFPGTASMECY